MKRINCVWLAAMIATMIATETVIAVAQQSASTQSTSSSMPPSGSITQSNTPSNAPEQPLGDYARGLRKDKKPVAAKKFDNDNLPMEDKLSVVGGSQNSATTTTATDETASTAAAQPEPTNQAAKLPPSVQPGQSQEEMQVVYGQWQDKISTQRDKIDQDSKQLEDLQREYRVRETQLYGDPGNRLRNDWEKEAQEYKQRLDEKQKDLDDAKAGMDNLEESARKAGVPNSVREAAAEGSGESKPSDNSSDHN